jgi:hypothetical protein
MFQNFTAIDHDTDFIKTASCLPRSSTASKFLRFLRIKVDVLVDVKLFRISVCDDKYMVLKNLKFDWLCSSEVKIFFTKIVVARRSNN